MRIDDVIGAVLAEDSGDDEDGGEDSDWPALASPRFLAAVRAQAAATAD